MLYWRLSCALAFLAFARAAPVGDAAVSTAPLSPAEQRKEASYERGCEAWMQSQGYTDNDAKAACSKDAGEWAQKKMCITAMRKEGGHTTNEIKKACETEADSDLQAQRLECRKEQRAKGVTEREAIEAACQHPEAHGGASVPAASAAPQTDESEHHAKPARDADAPAPAASVSPQLARMKLREAARLECRQAQRAQGVTDRGAIEAACADAGRDAVTDAPIASPASSALQLSLDAAASTAPLSPAEQRKEASYEKGCDAWMIAQGYADADAKAACAADAGEWAQKKMCISAMHKEGGHTTAEIKEACKTEGDSEREAERLQCRQEQRAKGVTDREAIKAACQHRSTHEHTHNQRDGDAPAPSTSAAPRL